MSLIVFIIDYLSRLFSSFTNKTDSSCVILYYHTVYPEEINEFKKQMDELLRWTRPIHINAIGQINRAGRYSAVTFDDGFICVLDNALPCSQSVIYPPLCLFRQAALANDHRGLTKKPNVAKMLL